MLAFAAKRTVKQFITRFFIASHQLNLHRVIGKQNILALGRIIVLPIINWCGIIPLIVRHTHIYFAATGAANTIACGKEYGVHPSVTSAGSLSPQ
ncbi:MAG: hypothetical protein NUV75_05385, partial [Gallionella sp.]|nr:hypothetical protein [Gallionella sp.]